VLIELIKVLGIQRKWTGSCCKRDDLRLNFELAVNRSQFDMKTCVSVRFAMDKREESKLRWIECGREQLA
jgi:hypothetical protein